MDAELNERLASSGAVLSSKDLLADPNAAGFHFEALALRDLRVYSQPLDGTIPS